MQPITRPIRWGILGTGAIAAAFANSLRHVTDTTLFAVGSRGQTSADDFAQTHDVDRAYASYSELVADPDVDVVYVAHPTPPTSKIPCCVLVRASMCSAKNPLL